MAIGLKQLLLKHKAEVIDIILTGFNEEEGLDEFKEEASQCFTPPARYAQIYDDEFYMV